MSDKSSNATIKLADFGFATHCPSATALSDLLGTPEYMGTLHHIYLSFYFLNFDSWTL